VIGLLRLWMVLGVALGGAGLVAGCGPHIIPRLFIIGDPAAPAPGVRSETGRGTIELKAVAVPDYLDSTDILRRTGPNELTPSPTGRWGERLSLGLTDALAAALAQRLPQWGVITRPTVAPVWRIAVEIERLDIGNGVCVLSARWGLTRSQTVPNAIGESGTFSVAALTPDDAAVAAAISGLVNQLADQIVTGFAGK